MRRRGWALEAVFVGLRLEKVLSWRRKGILPELERYARLRARTSLEWNYNAVVYSALHIFR